MNKTHFFWCLCPSDFEQDDDFTRDPKMVTCESCLAEMKFTAWQALDDGSMGDFDKLEESDYEKEK